MVRTLLALLVLMLFIGLSAGCGGDADRVETAAPAPAEEPDQGPYGNNGEDEDSAVEPPDAGNPGGDTTPAANPDTSGNSGNSGNSSNSGNSGGGIDPMPGAGTEPVSGDGSGTGTALLERAELGRHEGFDRVVFEFRDRLPAHQVRYVSPPIHEDGSGHEISVAGRHFVEIRMEPASSYDMEEQAVVFGERRLPGTQAGTSVLREVVRTGDFEAVLTWVAGISDRVDFRVTTLSDPPRLVVDFRNH